MNLKNKRNLLKIYILQKIIKINLINNVPFKTNMSFVKEEDVYQEFVKHIQDYMFNNTTICKSIENKIRENYNIKKNKQPTTSKEIESNKNKIIPLENDSLFWCLYIIKNGFMQYSQLTNKNIVIEKQLKIEYVERIRKEKYLVKQFKFDSISNIENKLVNENNIDNKTFLTLCVLGSLNIFLINNNTYYELNMNDSNKFYIVKFFKDKQKYGFEEVTKDVLDDYRKEYYKLDNVDKPVKSISSYTTKDLLDICKKLGIETIDIDKSTEKKEKTKSKKELYESIIKYF